MTKLNRLKGKGWKDLDSIILFGFGRQGRKMYRALHGEFRIAAILDNDPGKKGSMFDGHAVRSVEEAGDLLYRHKVIVTASQYYYRDISRQLSGLGLRENEDYAMYQQFVAEWFYRYRGEVHVLKTDLPLTSRCTLRCRHCMQFLPYWKQTGETPLQEIRENLDVYFRCVDRLLDLDIVGGEPFLYSRLPEFIRFLGENYRDRIGYAGFITNGTVVPGAETLELMAGYGLEVSVTDYSGSIAYRHRIPELLCALEKYHIRYMHNRKIDWFDFGFPEDTYHYTGEEAVRHMQRCNSIEHVLDRKRLYYCGLAWSAQKGGLFEDEEKGYVDLEKTADAAAGRKREILELVLGNIEGGCLEFCGRCGGFGTDNSNLVGTARQMPGRGQDYEF